MPPRKLPNPINENQSRVRPKRKGAVIGSGDGSGTGIGSINEGGTVIGSISATKNMSPVQPMSPTAFISNLTGGMVYSICIHHSGKFFKKPDRDYVGGFRVFYPILGIENVKLTELDKILGKFKNGDENSVIYYKIPGMNLDIGLKVLKDDNDVEEILTNCEVHGYYEIDLYVDESGSFDESNIDVPDLEENFSNYRDVSIDIDFDEQVEQVCQTVEASLGCDSGQVNELETECNNNDSGSETDSDFVDSEYEHDESDDDDALYDDCVDKTVEWGGVSNDGAIAGGSKGKRARELDDNDVDLCGLDDDLHSVHSSDDENPRLPEFNSAADMRNVDFSVGMLFASKDILRQAILEYGLQNSKAVQMYKNDKKRVRAWCTKGLCPWRMYAANVKGEKTFQVRTYQNEHNCGRVFKNKLVRAPWLAKKYLSEFRAEPEWSIRSFKARLQGDYIVGCSRSQLYRARSMAIGLVTGSEKEQYSRVYDYCEELRKSNPGTTAIVQTEGSLAENGRPTFKRIYICLGACKNGFKAGCRKVIGVDGCHLKGASTGQILAAVGIDANDQSFPIAYAVVEAETRDSWEWFIRLLKDDLDISREAESSFTFINDKQKGLIPALEALVGEAEHRHCAWHLYTNFKEHHRGKQLKDKMDQASKASTVPAFHKAMGELRALDEAAYQWLATKDEPRYWSRSHFRTVSKCDMLTNNPCESFNSFIKDARDKPILSLCETIRNLLMDRFRIRKHKMQKHQNKFCPNIVQKLEKLKVDSCGWSPLWSGDLLYQVSCSDHEQYAVDLDKRTCTCRKWDLNGIPCAHAISAIYHHNFIPEDFVHECYLTSTNLKIYEQVIYPMNGQSMWPETPYNRPLPPPYKKQPGRPKKLRKRGITEKPLPKTGKMRRQGMGIKCRYCGTSGHNFRSCEKRKLAELQGASQSNQPASTQNRGANSNNEHYPSQTSQGSIVNSSVGLTPMQLSQPTVRRSPRKHSTSSSQPSMQKLKPRRNAAKASGSANANVSTKFSSSQAAKYNTLVNQGKFREI